MTRATELILKTIEVVAIFLNNKSDIFLLRGSQDFQIFCCLLIASGFFFLKNKLAYSKFETLQFEKSSVWNFVFWLGIAQKGWA